MQHLDVPILAPQPSQQWLISRHLCRRLGGVKMLEFKKFPKIARLSREIIVTEKIDGTNGVVHVGEEQEP